MLKLLKLGRSSVAAKWNILALMFIIVVVCLEPAIAVEAPKASAQDDRGIGERLGEAAQNMEKKIDEAVTELVKKFEEQRAGERLREKMKNAATKTGEELERVGKEIRDKFSN